MWQNRGWKVLHGKRPWPRQPLRRDCIDKQCKADFICESDHSIPVALPVEIDLHSNSRKYKEVSKGRLF